MGNCTSKKSNKAHKLHISNKVLFGRKMDKDPANTKILSTKVAPVVTKGSAMSFGFNKKRPISALPVPVTLTSRSGKSDDVISSSSVESLSHNVFTNKINKETNTPSHNMENFKQPVPPAIGASNKFGFRSGTPTKNKSKENSPSPSNRLRKSPASARSRSEGPREAFFRQFLQPAGSMQSVVNFPSPTVPASLNPGKFTLQSSQLPRPQFAVRICDKSLKTATNTSRRDGSPLFTTEDSGIGSHTSEGSDISESGPATLSKHKKPVPGQKLDLHIVSNNKFELYQSGIKKQNTNVTINRPTSSVSTGLVQKRTEQYLQRLTIGLNGPKLSSGFNNPSIESEEEKLKADSQGSEKKPSKFLMTEGAGENDEFLPGETMADDDILLSISSDEELSATECDLQTKNNIPLDASLSFMIKVEALRLSNQLRKTAEELPATQSAEVDDNSYDILNSEDRAVLEAGGLLLDMISSSSESSVEQKSNAYNETKITETNKETFADSPATPSHASISEGRDFLIDDEIADQPELCFSTHEEVGLDKIMTSSSNNNVVYDVHNDSIGKPISPCKDDNSISHLNNQQRRKNSVGTLSPCDSLMSDDLMMDYEMESNDIRCDEANDVDVNLVACQADALLNDWANLSRQRACNGLNGLAKRNGASLSSSPTSMKSENSRRTSEDGDFSIKLDKASYQNVFQDIVSIKSMLLKLNRVLTEGDNDGMVVDHEKDGIIELKKQVAFLQQQLEQREHTVQLLQMEINRGVDRSHSKGSIAPTLCNAATQTDRIRPTSTGPSILHNLPSDSNVISNGTLRKSAEPQPQKLPHNENNLQSFIRPTMISKNEENIRSWKSAENGHRASAPAEKILEKVKALSFKPVEVLEREKINNAIQAKNVFKITKIDLVLKSDNYGRTELRKS